MGHLRLLWRLFRLATFELPILILIIAVVMAAVENTSTGWISEFFIWISISFIGFAVLALLFVVWRRPSKIFGSAHFATGKDLRRSDLRGKGLILGKMGGRFIRFNKPGHLLTFAPTRSGKGVGAVIPNLLDHQGSVVVTDIKGENYRITAEYRNQLGPVLALAPFDPQIGNACFNPIDFIRVGSPHEVDDTRLLAEMIIVTDKSEANHWEREARTLITGLLLYIATDMPPEKRNLSELRRLLMCNRHTFDAHLDLMVESDHMVVSRIADGFSQKEDKERGAVVSTAQSGTEVFESPQLAAIINKSSFRFESLKDGVMSLYIIIPPEYLRVYQPFMRLIVGLAMAAMSRNINVPERPVLFLLDELPALGYMRPVEDGIGYLAGYGVSLWLFVQDLDQLKQTYKKWLSMIANCAVRQAFNIQDPETAELVSHMLGQRTVKVQSESHSGRFFRLGLPSNFSTTNMETGRALLSPDEAMMLPGTIQLLFVQGCRPIRSEKVRYYNDWAFRNRCTKWRMGS